jgi:hypothetical protein
LPVGHADNSFSRIFAKVSSSIRCCLTFITDHSPLFPVW